MDPETPRSDDLADRLEREAKRSSAPSRRVMLYLDDSVYRRFKGFCVSRSLSMTRAAQIFIENGLDLLEAHED